jgi:RimJ/RimL family protein N-acetyltransferase
MAECGAIEPFAFVVDELLARPYRPPDAPALTQAVHESREGLSRWLDWCHPDYGLGDAERWIADCESAWRSGDQYAFAVFEADGMRFLGAVGISQRDRRCNHAGIGYWTRESARGRAISARIVPHVAAFGLDRVGLGRIEILAAVDNLASRRTAERAGAHFEGVQRRRLRNATTMFDAATYSFVAGDIGRQSGPVAAQMRSMSS